MSERRTDLTWESAEEQAPCKISPSPLNNIVLHNQNYYEITNITISPTFTLLNNMKLQL